MFEFAVALKYLIPRRRQLSVSIISTISILVIALVVWLILVFFSVTDGLEKIWVEKLTTLTAPVRILPTSKYTHSYYNQIDSISEKSQYTTKSIEEKLHAKVTDPYDPHVDEEVPAQWPAPDLNSDGSLKDIVKETFAAIQGIPTVPGLTASDFEITFSNIRLRLVRDNGEGAIPAFLNQGIYLGSFDPVNPTLYKTKINPTIADLSNILQSTLYSTEGLQSKDDNDVVKVEPQELQSRLRTFFDHVNITGLKTAPHGWNIPQGFLPLNGQFVAYALMRNDQPARLFLPLDAKQGEKWFSRLQSAGHKVKRGTLHIQSARYTFSPEGEGRTLDVQRTPVALEGGITLPVKLVEASLATAKSPKEIKFELSINLQGTPLKGPVPLGKLEIAQATVNDLFSSAPPNKPFWIYRQNEGQKSSWVLPRDSRVGEGVLLPKTFRDAGVLVGDQGVLSYYTSTATSMQEQSIPIYVAGFFDHGVIPMGGKFIMAHRDIASLIRTAYDQGYSSGTTGIHVRFDNIDQADDVKAAIQKGFDQRGLSPYWTVQTYREYDFAKDILLQLQSEKNLFSLISIVIIVVACSNIISMLIILVNDKKVEIGILRAMGATSRSIAAIFGLCGMMMGMMGSIIGIFLAIATLKNLSSLLDLISSLQGHQLLNRTYYGDTMPTDISVEALAFVLVTTVVISLLAGIVPAVKASLLRPSATLRSE